MASLVMKQQPYLKDQGKDILDKVNSTTSAALEKPELRAQLRGLKEAADNHTDNVGAWVQAVKTSVKYGKNGYPMQPTPDAKENQEGLPTSQKDDYQHPVYSWPEAVIDAINAVESRPASPNGERNA